MARRLDEGELEELLRGLWEKRQLPPSWLDSRTPHEILFLFGSRSSSDDDELDPVAEMHRLNHTKRAPKGLPPITPDWLMPEVPR